MKKLKHWRNNRSIKNQVVEYQVTKRTNRMETATKQTKGKTEGKINIPSGDGSKYDKYWKKIANRKKQRKIVIRTRKHAKL